ncbi:hypothetical protein DFH94DRAFT_354508 [Russula ochroleuca]|uniref:EF-hand domain-containing protein n=1 Tax=Russula ochroleuca TaxID=152965 RepID=A0A9P5JUP5_9AGAM|nr:hypothetical protein DFH94DRAFT_354508 [Russula ochroleuca]
MDPPNPSHPGIHTTCPSKSLHPPPGCPLRAQHIARTPPIPCKVATPDRETPHIPIGRAILATTTLIQVISRNRATSLRRVAINPSLKQTVSPHIRRRILRLTTRNWFVAIDQDGNEELSYEELRSALLTNGNRQFSSVTVKYLVSIFDLNGDGVIGFEEFEPLWSYLNQWIRMFDSFDQDRNGIIDTAELGHALANYGIQLAPDVIDIVMKKYGEAPAAPSWNRQLVPAPLMELDHFVCACVSVREMCRVYEDCSAEGRPRMDRDAFLRAVLVLP